VTALAQAFGRPFQSTKNVSKHLAELEQLATSQRIPLNTRAAVSQVYRDRRTGEIGVDIMHPPTTHGVLEEMQHLKNVLATRWPDTYEQILREELRAKLAVYAHPDLNVIDRLILRLQMRDIRAGRYY